MSPESVASQDQNYLVGKVESFNRGQATLRLSDGQTVLWPMDKFPIGVSEGSEVRLAILNESSESERNKLAKAILNQVLKNEDDEERA